jgi:hypothetical protein
MAQQRPAIYGRYAWVLLVLVAAFMTLAAIGYIVFGLQAIPDYELSLPDGRVSTGPLLEQSPAPLTPIFQNTLMEYGIMRAALGILVIVVAAVPYRRGQRWAWYALWVLPLALLGANINAVRLELNLGPLPILLVVAVLGMLLPVRRFFASPDRVVN